MLTCDVQFACSLENFQLTFVPPLFFPLDKHLNIFYAKKKNALNLIFDVQSQLFMQTNDVQKWQIYIANVTYTESNICFCAADNFLCL